MTGRQWYIGSMSVMCTQHVNKSILIPQGANASHDALKHCKSYVNQGQ